MSTIRSNSSRKSLSSKEVTPGGCLDPSPININLSASIPRDSAE